jgi:type I restriction enzyme S subunit
MGLLDPPLFGGRRWIRVGDAYAVTRKPRGLDRAAAPLVPFAAMAAIPQGGGYAPAFTMKPLQAIQSGTYFERGDLLVAKITPSFENGKQALILDLPTPFGYATTEVIPLHPRDVRQDRRLLFFYLLHPDIRHYIAERMEGSTGRRRVPESVLLDLPFPELEASEQSRVAEVLELLRRAVDVQATCESVTFRLKQAAMHELFARGSGSWDVCRLGDHFIVGSGGTPSRSVPEYWSGGTIRWVKTTEVNYCTIYDTEEKITPQGLRNAVAKLLSPGTLLLAMYGQGVTRGKVAILGVEAACNQACAWLSPSDARIDTRYLYHFLSYRYDAIRQLAHGGQQQNLNLDIVRELLVAVPGDADSQRERVAILDDIDRKLDVHRRKRALFEDLFRSLLHKLLIGEVSASALDLTALDLTAVRPAGCSAEVHAG